MGVDATAADRLPWLADEPLRQPQSNHGPSLQAWTAAVVAMVGIAAIWIGVRTIDRGAVPNVQPAQATMTVQLPPPHAAVQPEVRMPVERELRPVSVVDVRAKTSRDARIAGAPHLKAPHRGTATLFSDRQAARTRLHKVHVGRSASAPATVSGVAANPFVKPKPWNPRVFKGAAGRLVQIGAFGSVSKAKHGWRFMVRQYPAMAHLPAVVRPTRNSKGQLFYRFQVGTTSQAHSEVLCQRMERIVLSCAVIGLPWKARVER